MSDTLAPQLAGAVASIEAVLMLERRANQLLFATRDQKEGMQTFIDKRKPQFEGRRRSGARAGRPRGYRPNRVGAKRAALKKSDASRPALIALRRNPNDHIERLSPRRIHLPAWLVHDSRRRRTQHTQALGCALLWSGFALYRGRATGKVVLSTPHCPHMKTHLAAPNTTSCVVLDRGGSNVEGDDMRCPYHAWRSARTASATKFRTTRVPSPRSLASRPGSSRKTWARSGSGTTPRAAIPSGNTPRDWLDPAWVRWKFDHLGLLNQHVQEVIDNIADRGGAGILNDGVASTTWPVRPVQPEITSSIEPRP
jgi:hypothetical protein